MIIGRPCRFDTDDARRRSGWSKSHYSTPGSFKVRHPAAAIHT
jgi:hypothetical protein